MKKITLYALLTFITFMGLVSNPARAKEPVDFVVQLTRSGDNYGHRRVFLQLDKVLHDLGQDKVRFVVVAYEEGILALVSSNKETNQLLTKLANAGVEFKACRISMRAWGLEEADFPLEVEFVPAGAPDVIQRQIQGYKYWRP